MPQVRIPTILRPSVEGAVLVEAAGSTVGEVLRSIGDAHLGFASLVFESDGTLKRYLAVFVGDRDARHLRGLDTPVEADDEVVVLPAASGGTA